MAPEDLEREYQASGRFAVKDLTPEQDQVLEKLRSTSGELPHHRTTFGSVVAHGPPFTHLSSSHLSSLVRRDGSYVQTGGYHKRANDLRLLFHDEPLPHGMIVTVDGVGGTPGDERYAVNVEHRPWISGAVRSGVNSHFDRIVGDLVGRLRENLFRVLDHPSHPGVADGQASRSATRMPVPHDAWLPKPPRGLKTMFVVKHPGGFTEEHRQAGRMDDLLGNW